MWRRNRAQSAGLLRSSEVVVVILSALMVLSLLDSRRAHRIGQAHGQQV